MFKQAEQVGFAVDDFGRSEESPNTLAPIEGLPTLFRRCSTLPCPGPFLRM